MSRSLDENKELLEKLQKDITKIIKTKDTLIGQIAVEKRNIEKAITDLSSFGLDVKSLSNQELKDLKTRLETELSTSVDELSDLVEKGKQLMEKVQL